MSELLDDNQGLEEKIRKHELNPFQLQKAVRIEAIELLDKNVSKSEIYEAMVDKYGRSDEKIIAKTIAVSLPISEKQKHGLLQNILIGLLLLSIVGTVYRYYYILQGTQNIIPIIIMCLFISLHFVLIKGVYIFRGDRLYSIMFFALLRIYGFASILSTQQNKWPYFFLTLLIFELGFAYFLKKQAFPNLCYGGPQKNGMGGYHF